MDKSEMARRAGGVREMDRGPCALAALVARGCMGAAFHTLPDKPDFEYALIDSTISKVHAEATGAKGG